jgi:PAS domain S-box-containing protein
MTTLYNPVAQDIYTHPEIHEVNFNPYECIGKSVSDMVISFDHNFIVTYLNEKAAQLLNYKQEELIGFHIIELFPKSQLEFLEVLLQEALEKRQIYNRRSCFCVRGKKQLPVSISFSSIAQDDNTSFIMIAKDDRQLVRATEELKKKNAELETLIYRISHDLKGPLASMNGLFQLMELEADNPEAIQNYMQLIKKSAQRLEEKLLGLLELGLAKKDGVEYTSIPVREKLKEIIADLQPFPGKDKVIIHLTATESFNFHTEEKLFQSIMQNLIENSIKYRKPNIEDAVTKVSVRKYKNGIKIKVKDNGLGMDKDLQKRAFDMFYRGHNHTEGSGLGMFIVKTHVEKLGGEIGIKSTPQMGTEVWVYLPDPTLQNKNYDKLVVKA